MRAYQFSKRRRIGMRALGVAAASACMLQGTAAAASPPVTATVSSSPAAALQPAPAFTGLSTPNVQVVELTLSSASLNMLLAANQNLFDDPLGFAREATKFVVEHASSAITVLMKSAGGAVIGVLVCSAVSGGTCAVVAGAAAVGALIGAGWGLTGVASASTLDMMSAGAAATVSPTDTARATMTSEQIFDEWLRSVTNPGDQIFVVDQSTAGLSDVVIGGPLSFLIYDYATEDNDQVALSVNSAGFNILSTNVTMTNAGTTFSNLPAREGSIAVISLTALNEGLYSPNTGALRVTTPLIISGNPSQTYTLNTGQTGFMRVYVAGRRFRGN